MNRQAWGIVLLLALTPVLRADEASAVAALEKLKATVKREDNDPKNPVVEVSLANLLAGDGDLAALKDLPALRKLDLTGTQVTPAGLEGLKGLKSLDELHLGGPQLSDGVFKMLRRNGMFHLLARATAKDGKRPATEEAVYALDLTRAEVTDFGLAELADLRGLRVLNIAETLVTDTKLKELKYLKQIDTLTLGKHQMTETGLRSLREAGLLHTLWIAAAKDSKRPARIADVYSLDFSAAGLSLSVLKELNGFTGLRELYLPSAQITDQGLATLVQLDLLYALSRAVGKGGERPAGTTDVEKLYLHNTPVTYQGVKHLKGLKNLRELHLQQFNDATAKELTAIGLLHTFPGATTRDGKRPASADDVHRLDLWDTGWNGDGLKEFKNLEWVRVGELHDPGARDFRTLKNLKEAHVRNAGSLWYGGPQGMKELARIERLTFYQPAGLTAAHLTQLREAGLLHCLTRATGRDGKRAATDDDIVALDLSEASLGDQGFRELKGLKSLRALNLHRAEVSATALRELHDFAGLEELGLELLRNRGDHPLKELKGLKGLRKLDLSHARIENKGLEELQELLEDLTNLEELRLTGPLTDAEMRVIGRLKKLRVLHLSHQQKVTPSGWKELKNLPELRVLHAHRSRLGDLSLSWLREAPKLEELHLSETPVTDKGLAELRRCKNLRVLELARCESVTDKGLIELRNLTNLRELGLSRCKVSNAGMRSLAGLTALEALDLAETQVTASGLRELKDCKNLNELHLYHTQITDETLKALREADQLHALTRATTRHGRRYGLFAENKLDRVLYPDEYYKRPTGPQDVWEFDLSGCFVTDAGVRELKGLTNLRVLKLREKKFTDAVMKDVKDFPKLEEVDLVGTEVTDAGLRELKGMHTLRRIRTGIGVKTITEAGLDELLRSVPSAQRVW